MPADSFMDHARLVASVAVAAALLTASLLAVWYLAYALALRDIGFIRELLGNRKKEKKLSREQAAAEIQETKQKFAAGHGFNRPTMSQRLVKLQTR
eukprot:jgi/Tetstr1/425288/TSEL_015739.t1